ncbi:hypothetical protein O6H91_19G028300 [Diphasiastrum complanatum]|uniref:Uncharacterized protein n=1 Tax=Diphasiastrum complanatum TaxID=34168 RepID=A0ACC2ATQ9_DIPCM|nr:hypothetical protein O6H91_19G028300 [Diphasiastrum complanatum]
MENNYVVNGMNIEGRKVVDSGIAKSSTRLENSIESFQPAESKIDDAGALFVLESKGTWVHAGYHLTTSIAQPSLLSLPFAFVGLGWGPGILGLITGAAVTFYAYYLLSRILEDSETRGHRYIRFRDLSRDVLGPAWSRLVILPFQLTLCVGAVIGAVLLGGQSLKIVYLQYFPNGSLQLYQFIIISGAAMLFLSQLPSFHSLRYMNLVSLVTCLGYSICVVSSAIYIVHSKQAPKRDYSLPYGPSNKFFNVFTSLSLIATNYGNGIIPEIQATIAPPTSQKMLKGLIICYIIVVSTYFPVTVSGYWAFGNHASGNIFINFITVHGVPLIPKWLLILSNALVIVQLIAVALVYSQPTFEIIEGRSSNIKYGKYGLRNLLPRLLLRTLFVAFPTLVAAMLPFFGDIYAFLGAFFCIPFDFILPMVFYSKYFKLSTRSVMFWINASIIIVFTIVGLLGCISTIRQIILDAKMYKLFANV